MAKGAVTVSIDLELAWGRWDNLEQRQIEHVESSERPIVSRLIGILDRHQFPVTWAIVAALLDPASAKGRPGSEHLWYGPDRPGGPVRRLRILREGGGRSEGLR